MSHGRESWGIHAKLRMSNVWEARGILGEESWERNHGRGIMGEESWERNHESWRHPAGTSTKQRLPRGSQKAPRRHPGGTQEAPRGTQGTQESWEEKGDKTIVFYSRKWRERPFRVHETSATLTKYRKL